MSKRGFTLLELVLVLGLMALLGALSWAYFSGGPGRSSQSDLETAQGILETQLKRAALMAKSQRVSVGLIEGEQSEAWALMKKSSRDWEIVEWVYVPSSVALKLHGGQALGIKQGIVFDEKGMLRGDVQCVLSSGDKQVELQLKVDNDA